VIIASALLLIPGAVLHQGCRKEDDAEAIRALVSRESVATQKEDLQALAEIWSQERGILLFTVGAQGRADGWERIARVFKEFFDRVSDLRLTVDELQVLVSGDLAYATYDWAMAGRAGDYALDDRGHATAVYRRGPQGWKLVHAHYSPIHPALAAAAAEAGAPAAGRGGAAAIPAPVAAPRGTPAPAGTAAPRGTPAPARTPGGT
jgi:ketosteroid isomerase-like protein